MFDGAAPDCQIVGISAAELPRWLPRVSGYIARMAEGSRGRYSAPDIVRALEERDMQLWLALHGPDIRCAVITTLVGYPQGLAVRFIGMVGRGHKEWAHYREVIEAWGKSRGAVMAEALVADMKFRHILPGYDVDHILLSKAL